MTIYTTLLLALGVAMDAFAVAVAAGSTSRRVKFFEAARLALLFGVFQMFMPMIGWFIGSRFSYVISAADHWIAFILLGGIGGKMIYDDLTATNDDVEEEISQNASHSIYSLLILAFATSIDALAVGLSLNFLNSITFQVIAIGIVTLLLSLAGVYLGHRYRHFGRNKVKIFGGLILIAIGIKILFEHLTNS